MKDILGAALAGLAVVIVIVVIVGAVFFNAQANRNKEIHQYDLCVKSGGTYVKTYTSPLCLRSDMTAEQLDD